MLRHFQKMTNTSVKKKRVSKKSKLSWRKHVNINDVEDFLEDKRLEERLGPPLSTLSDGELFTIDTGKEVVKELTPKQKRKLKALEPPKCFAMLQPHTKVQDPITKRNRVRTKEERKNELVKKKEAENRAKGILKAREIQSINDRRNMEIKKEKKRKHFEDVWGSEAATELEKNEWINNNAKKHQLAGSGKLRKIVKISQNSKRSVFPSVEVPHPGMSYNPSYQDHQNLLKTIVEKEMQIIKEEKHLDRVTRHMFSKVTEDKRDAAWLSEMNQGLSTSEKSQDNGEESDEEFKSINPPVVNRKKTLQQRRKQKEQQRLELGKKIAKKEKKKVSDIHQLKTLHKVIVKKETEAEILRKRREKIKLLKQKEPKRLSAMKFEESELDFNLGHDISGNLRSLKKEGNLLNDRFKSLQKRNILEPSVRRHRKKAKVKIFTKPGHKEDWIKTVAR